MRFVTLALVFMLTGCLGNPEPHNPLTSIRITQEARLAVMQEPLWWQLDTSEMKPKDNPWNKFVPTYKEKDWSDPWADFKEPKLFPKNWKTRPHLNLDLKWQNLKLRYHLDKARETIKELQRPKVEKTKEERLRDLRKREREYFRRSI